jgi:hypothetical protein
MPASQAGRRGFDPRLPLQAFNHFRQILCTTARQLFIAAGLRSNARRIACKETSHGGLTPISKGSDICACFVPAKMGRCSISLQRLPHDIGKGESKLELWLPKYPIRQATRDHALRICAPEPFRLGWTKDGGKTWHDSDCRSTGIGGEYFDSPAADFSPQIEFTFFWTSRGQCEGQNYRVQARWETISNAKHT